MSADSTLDKWADQLGTTDDAGESRSYDGPRDRKAQYDRLADTGAHVRITPPDNGVKLDADPEKGEAWCNPDEGGCQNRLTIGTSGQEYGHATDCEYSCYELEGDE